MNDQNMILLDEYRHFLENNPFWMFSNEFYAQDPVKTACLSLQENCHINVNIVLFCIWFARSGQGRLIGYDIHKALHAIEPWHSQITLALRQLRDSIKHNAKHRQHYLFTLEQEIAAERMEQTLLYDAIKKPYLERALHQRLRDACRNIKTYFDVLSIPIRTDSKKNIQVLMEHAFFNLQHEQITSIVDLIFNQDNEQQLTQTLDLINS